MIAGKMIFMLNKKQLRQKFSLLDIGYWILDIGYWILDIGYWILDIGYWILDIGYWIFYYAILLRLCQVKILS